MHIDPGMPPRLRLDPSTNFQAVLAGAARLAMLAVGLLALIVCLKFGQMLLAPLFLAVVIGLMFGPVADRIERFGVPSTLSAAAVVLLFLVLIAIAIVGLAVPLSAWVERLPQIWGRLQTEIAKWQGAIAALENLQDTAKSLFAEGENMVVTVDEGSTVGTAAFVAPGIAAQIATFLVSMYFFIATRHEIRASVLSLCYSRRLRWRMARVFRDVEALISRFMLSITAINIGLGTAVTLALWAIGVPTPLLWGMLAALVNYVAYVGPAVMVAILLAVGLGTGATPTEILTPALVYLGLNFVSDQFITPAVIGRSMRLNPFFVFLAIAFWLWLWGPVGGFVAIPSLLVALTILRHLLGNPSRSAPGLTAPAPAPPPRAG